MARGRNIDEAPEDQDLRVTENDQWQCKIV